MAKSSAPVGTGGYDPASLSSFSFSAAPATGPKAPAQASVAAPPSPRTRTANKSERRRSLPLASLAATAEEDVVQVKKSSRTSRHDRQQQSDLSAPASARPLYERRRNDGAMSPTLTVNTPVAPAAPSALTTHNTHNTHTLHTSRSIQSDRASQRSAASDTFSVSRLRSNSGLSLHTNSAALRRYIDYNVDGSSRLSPTRERAMSAAEPDGRTLDDRGSDAAAAASPSFGGLFSWDTVRAVLDHPVARERLWAYTRATGGTENLEFLETVEQYAKALHGVTALMAAISTKFTCVTATEPLRLPAHLAKALNTDVKHVSSSILPGLEMLFGDVDAHIKDRVLRHIYPAFARHQLGLRMKRSLGASSSSSSSACAADASFTFPGLGRAFCLTDPYRPDSPIVYASDTFAHLLGYDCAEQIPRTGRFFRGPEPTQSAKNQEQFTEELVLSRNHRDNRPFWSLVSACPLKNASGRVRFILYGLVDVTDAVKSQHDIVHALCVQPSSATAAPVSPDAPSTSAGDRRMSVFSASDMPPPPSSSRDKISKSSFFNPFSRRRKTVVAADDASSRASSRAGKASPTPSADQVSPRGAPPSLALAMPPPAPPLLPADLLATYSHFMVLQYVPGTSSDAGYDPEAVPQRRGSRYGAGIGTLPAALPAPPTSAGAVSRLKVAFSSIPMLELLGLGPAAQDAVMYHDVFAVLSELAGSPSITPVFRASVRQHVVTSEAASLELSVPASSGVPGLTGAPGALSAGLGAGLASPNTCPGAGDEFANGGSSTQRRSSLLPGARRPSRHDDDDVPSGWPGRRRRSSERPPSAAQKAREPKMQRLMSHWTPLKDVDGSVAWVILVMSPIVE